MESAGSSASGDFDARTDFAQFLERIERRNFENKRFYHPPQVKEWMCLESHADRLLTEVYAADTKHFQPTRAGQLQDNLIVFAILLHPDVQCGNFIHVFRKLITDANLQIQDLSRVYDNIVKELEDEGIPLPRRWKTQDYRAITEAFERQRWAFRPVLLELGMDISIPHASSILPFCFKRLINDKGGTAGVYEYKIQHDLVSNSSLQAALQNSLVEDDEFGKCYQFAVKTYTKYWNDIYKIESEAFKGVRELKGVVKYLGEYQLGTSSESSQASSSRNIMLEYGELDLDEYLADNYPPVLSEEIIAFWEGLFGVADTLKRIHHLQDGDHVYRGWHGDVKPDNILRVRGEYKLADFGFTIFEREQIGKTSTFLPGGTRTYGAPECDRGATGGTLTPYSQTIDTWSFGCVLSAVATWVVLGSHAYENYRQMRVMAIKALQRQRRNGKEVLVPSCDDAFHDGKEVLSAVTEWHKYLRNSLRKADTITDRILYLIDHSMLTPRPDQRMTLKELCNELDSILTVAKDTYSKHLDNRVLMKFSPEMLKALLELDNQAPVKATPGFKAEAQSVRNPGALGVPGEGQDTSLPATRVRKSERFDKILSAKTAGRQDVILQRLPTGPGISQSPAQMPSRVADSTSTSLPRGHEGRSNIPGIRLEPDSPEQLPSFSSSSIPSPTTKRAQKPRRPGGPSQNAPNPFDRRDMGETHPLQQPVAKYKQDEETGSTRALPRPELTAPSASPPVTTDYRGLPGVSELPAILAEGSNHPQRTEPGASVRPKGADTLFSDDGEERHDQTQLVIEPKLEQTAIWQTHEVLEKHWANPGTWGKFLGRVPEDPRLKRFILNRDIIFIIDNAYSMRNHWEAMKTTLLTLAMKIGPLDEDGLDLEYTCGEDNKVRGARKWDIRKQFRQSMENAWGVLNPNDKTDMAETLARAFDSYMAGNLKKRQTLIILTDGLWEGSKDWDAVEKEIAQHINAMRKRLGRRERRWYTIQFVSFGQNPKAVDRLQELDDKLRGLDEDVVDTKPWHFPEVEKILLGSIKEDADEADGKLLSPISDGNLSPLDSIATAKGISRRPSRILQRFLKSER